MHTTLRDLLGDAGFGDVPAERSRAMGAVKGRGNRTTELRFKMCLVRKRMDGWRLHRRIGTTRPDLYFARERVAVFLNGCFWHGCPLCGHTPRTNSSYWARKIEMNKARDCDNFRVLGEEGILAVVFWEHEIAQDVGACVDRLAADLKSRSRTAASLGAKYKSTLGPRDCP